MTVKDPAKRPDVNAILRSPILLRRVPHIVQQLGSLVAAPPSPPPMAMAKTANNTAPLRLATTCSACRTCLTAAHPGAACDHSTTNSGRKKQRSASFEWPWCGSGACHRARSNEKKVLISSRAAAATATGGSRSAKATRCKASLGGVNNKVPYLKLHRASSGKVPLRASSPPPCPGVLGPATPATAYATKRPHAVGAAEKWTSTTQASIVHPVNASQHVEPIPISSRYFPTNFRAAKEECSRHGVQSHRANGAPR